VCQIFGPRYIVSIYRISVRWYNVKGVFTPRMPCGAVRHTAWHRNSTHPVCRRVASCEALGHVPLSSISNNLFFFGSVGTAQNLMTANLCGYPSKTIWQSVTAAAVRRLVSATWIYFVSFLCDKLFSFRPIFVLPVASNPGDTTAGVNEPLGAWWLSVCLL